MNYTMATYGLAALLVAGCGGKTSSTTDTAENTAEEATDVDAATVYMNFCSGCHASDGTGAAGPDLTQSIRLLSDGDLMDVLENGVGTMAAPSLSEAEEDALFLYLRERFGEYGGT